MNIISKRILYHSLKFNQKIVGTSSRKLSSSEYCLDMIKKFDYENFVCTLLLKNEARTCGITIRAFNVEISRVQDQVSDSKLGLMRMKFWEDAVDSCFARAGRIPNHPVIIELDRIMRRNKFTKRYFNNLINSRKELIISNSFKTIEDMEKYVEQSVSSVYYLLLEGCGVRNVHADHAVSHLGKAQGLCQLLRSIPLIRQTNFIALPQQLLAEHRISHEDIIRGRNSEDVKDCVFKVATRAHQHLEKARGLSKTVPVEAYSVLLPAGAVDKYLQRLLNVNCDIFHKRMQLRNLNWIPTVWWNNMRHRY